MEGLAESTTFFPPRKGFSLAAAGLQQQTVCRVWRKALSTAKGRVFRSRCKVTVIQQCLPTKYGIKTEVCVCAFCCACYPSSPPTSQITTTKLTLCTKKDNSRNTQAVSGEGGANTPVALTIVAHSAAQTSLASSGNPHFPQAAGQPPSSCVVSTQQCGCPGKKFSDDKDENDEEKEESKKASNQEEQFWLASAAWWWWQRF